MKTTPFAATLADSSGRQVRVGFQSRNRETATGEALAICAKRQRATGVEWRVLSIETGGRV